MIRTIAINKSPAPMLPKIMNLFRFIVQICFGDLSDAMLCFQS